MLYIVSKVSTEPVSQIPVIICYFNVCYTSGSLPTAVTLATIIITNCIRTAFADL